MGRVETRHEVAAGRWTLGSSRLREGSRGRDGGARRRGEGADRDEHGGGRTPAARSPRTRHRPRGSGASRPPAVSAAALSMTPTKITASGGTANTAARNPPPPPVHDRAGRRGRWTGRARARPAAPGRPPPRRTRGPRAPGGRACRRRPSCAPASSILASQKRSAQRRSWVATRSPSPPGSPRSVAQPGGGDLVECGGRLVEQRHLGVRVNARAIGARSPPNSSRPARGERRLEPGRHQRAVAAIPRQRVEAVAEVLLDRGQHQRRLRDQSDATAQLPCASVRASTPSSVTVRLHLDQADQAPQERALPRSGRREQRGRGPRRAAAGDVAQDVAIAEGNAEPDRRQPGVAGATIGGSSTVRLSS